LSACCRRIGAGVIMLEEYSIKRLHEWIEAQLQAP